MTVNAEFHLLNKFPEAFMLVGPNGMIAEMNSVAVQMFGPHSGHKLSSIFENSPQSIDELANVDENTPFATKLISFGIGYDCICVKIDEDILIRCRVSDSQNTATQFRPTSPNDNSAVRNQVNQAAIQALAELAVPYDDEVFFREFVKYFAWAFDARYGLVTLRPDPNLPCVKTIAFWGNGVLGENFSYDVTGTPCEKVYESGMIYYDERLQEEFPNDSDLAKMGVSSYLGFPLTDSKKQTIGHLCVLDNKPIDREQFKRPLLRIFAARAAAELERKRVLDELKHNQRIFAETQRIAHIGTWTWDIELNKVYWSEELYRITGVGEIGRPVDVNDWARLIHPDDREFVQKRMANAIERGDVVPMDYRIIRDDGTVRWLHAQGIVEKNHDGGTKFIIGTAHDITDRKRAEEKLTEHRDQLELMVQKRTEELVEKNIKLDASLYQERVATRAKSNFLAKMSHEIRTPINGILGLAQLLLESAHDDEQRENVRSILYSADTLLNTVNQILNLSKIEAGRFDVKLSAVDINAMVSKDFGVYQQQAKNAGNALRFHVNPEVPPYIETDRYVLHHILSNLIHNAIKFTKRGTIDVRLSARVGDNGESILHVEVADTGIGIPADRQNIVFNAFEQVDNSPERKYGGSGLGTVIVKQLCTLLGGRIWFESVYGVGTRFFVELPLQAADKPSENNLDRYESNLKKQWKFQKRPAVLVVDDNEVNRLVAGKILERYRCSVTYASSGLEAIQFADDNQYSLILMDIDMPEMNGLDATKKIRTSKLNRKTPVIAMTAHAMDGDKENFLTQGMDDFLGKPFRVEQLMDKVTQYCSTEK